MYAVIRYGGKQYRVEPGATVKVERLEGKVGSKVTFSGEDVLAVRTDEKFLSGKDAAVAKVTGRIIEQGRHPKVMVLKFKKTNQYRIKRGHRQDYTAIEVKDITV
jgi:large subunit ribosomal protein L21